MNYVPLTMRKRRTKKEDDDEKDQLHDDRESMSQWEAHIIRSLLEQTTVSIHSTHRYVTLNIAMLI